jgi:hypothetical protein
MARFACDYRGLNEVARKDAYPLPGVDDIEIEIEIDYTMYRMLWMTFSMDLRTRNFTHTSTLRFAFGKFECVIRTSIRDLMA